MGRKPKFFARLSRVVSSPQLPLVGHRSRTVSAIRLLRSPKKHVQQPLDEAWARGAQAHRSWKGHDVSLVAVLASNEWDGAVITKSYSPSMSRYNNASGGDSM